MALDSVLAQGGPGMAILAWAVVQSICPSLWEQASFIIQSLFLSHGECEHTRTHVLMHVYTLRSTTVIHMHTHVHMCPTKYFPPVLILLPTPQAGM